MIRPFLLIDNLVFQKKFPLFAVCLWETTVSAKEHLCEMWFSMRKSFQLNAFVHGENVRSSSFCCEGVFQLKADEDKHFCIISLLSFTLYTAHQYKRESEQREKPCPSSCCQMRCTDSNSSVKLSWQLHRWQHDSNSSVKQAAAESHLVSVLDRLRFAVFFF